jgi:broad specificity phosphatase PhoE
MNKLYFIRHAQSQANVDGLFAGRMDTPLTEVGRGQAKQAGILIRETLPKIDLVISSPYARTRSTAEIICSQFNYPVENIIFDDLLFERDFGALEGTSREEFLKHHKFIETDCAEGAETVEQMDNRARRALARYSKLETDTILLVSHGGFGRALRRAVNSRPYTDEYEEYDSGAIGNAEIVELI